MKKNVNQVLAAYYANQNSVTQSCIKGFVSRLILKSK